MYLIVCTLNYYVLIGYRNCSAISITLNTFSNYVFTREYLTASFNIITFSSKGTILIASLNPKSAKIYIPPSYIYLQLLIYKKFIYYYNSIHTPSSYILVLKYSMKALNNMLSTLSIKPNVCFHEQ